MLFDDVMRIMLPPKFDPNTGERFDPHITSSDEPGGLNDFGLRKRANGSWEIHYGIDFNREGGQPNNQDHPAVSSPVSGTVEIPNDNPLGKVIIRDYEGNLHEISHLYAITVNNGDTIRFGDTIGLMGGQGENGPNTYDQHVDYKIGSSPN